MNISNSNSFPHWHSLTWLYFNKIPTLSRMLRAPLSCHICNFNACLNDFMSRTCMFHSWKQVTVIPMHIFIFKNQCNLILFHDCKGPVFICHIPTTASDVTAPTQLQAPWSAKRFLEGMGLKTLKSTMRMEKGTWDRPFTPSPRAREYEKSQQSWLCVKHTTKSSCSPCL